MRDFFPPPIPVKFWTPIQAHYDMKWAKMKLGDRLEKEVKVLSQSAVIAKRNRRGRVND